MHKRFKQCLCLLLSLCLAALAGLMFFGFEPFYDALQARSPAAAQWFRPVKRSCISNGIQMQTKPVNLKGNQASFLVDLTDLEGERLGEDVDLYMGWHYEDYCPTTLGNCRIHSWDEETKTLSLLVDVIREDGKPLLGRKFSFIMDYFIRGNRERIDNLPIDLSSADPEPETCTGRKITSWSYSNPKYDDYMPEEFLLPGELLALSDTIQITAMGYVDGLLRIQVHYSQAFESHIHGFVNLRDKDDYFYQPEYEVYYADESGAGVYNERFFEIPPGDLENFTAYCSLLNKDQIVTGDWEITLPLI